MLLELKNIFKWVTVGGTRTFILKDVNLKVYEGDFISVMGPQVQGNLLYLM